MPLHVPPHAGIHNEEASNRRNGQITMMEVRAYYGSFITTTNGMSGTFAVKLWWNPDGFWEPWNTGHGRYGTIAEAEDEAQGWAEADELPYLP